MPGQRVHGVGYCLGGTILAIGFPAASFRAEAVAWLVGLYITAAYWFTASTSFANPAVTLGRALTQTFSGIRPADVPGFVLAQLAGAVAATLVAGLLAGRRTPVVEPGLPG